MGLVALNIVNQQRDKSIILPYANAMKNYHTGELVKDL